MPAKLENQSSTLVFVDRGAPIDDQFTFERGFDLIKGPEFKQANKMLDAVLKDKQRNGREPAVQHKQSIAVYSVRLKH